jgi:hypothetical protein
MSDGEQSEQAEGEQGGDQHVVQGTHGLDPLTRSEQQPQEVGHSSAPPASEQSGVGASGIPDNPGADGGPTPEGDKGKPAEEGESD